jgi:hypothetical protein
MKTRLIIFDIETLTNLFKDYVGQVGFPPDAVPVKLMMNPQERKVALIVESESIPAGEPRKEEVKFDIRRFHPIGGVS